MTETVYQRSWSYCRSYRSNVLSSTCSPMLHPFRFFIFNDTATTYIYTLSLHDALPICLRRRPARIEDRRYDRPYDFRRPVDRIRSEEHTSELQSRVELVCRLLLEKKKKIQIQFFVQEKKKKTQIT